MDLLVVFFLASPPFSSHGKKNCFSKFPHLFHIAIKKKERKNHKSLKLPLLK